MTRVVLSERDFRRLVGGAIVRQRDVEIALNDIGWPRMLAAIEDAMAGGQHGEDPEAQDDRSRG